MVLGVRKQTVNSTVLGELGRLPLSRTAKFRSIEYWLKIQDNNNTNTQLQQFYNKQCEDNIHINNKNWVFHVKRTIDELGLSDLWFEQNLNVAFFQLFQQRIKDQFIQQWKSEIENSSRLKYYNKYKTEFCIEQYLLNIKNDKLRKQLTQFRLSAHKSAI